MAVTPAVKHVVECFEELGRRWGANPKVCAVHAILAVSDVPLTTNQISAQLDISEIEAADAISSLTDWKLAKRAFDGRVVTNGEPWDIALHIFDEVRRREFSLILDALGAAIKSARVDGTPRSVAMRIKRQSDFIEDLTHVNSRQLLSLLGMGRSFSKLFDAFRPDK